MLDSWNEGVTKSTLVDFVTRVTREGGPDYVPPAQRIATFDNDGTLWCEYPLPVQGLFLADRIKEITARDPTLKARQPFKAFLEKDHEMLRSLGKRGIVELFFATHAGISEEEFGDIAKRWFASATHPKLGRIPEHVVFQPQLELLQFLKEQGFKTYIVTGGGLDFVRAFAEHTYGVPPEQVIGSSAKLNLQERDGVPVLMKESELGTFDDREVKVQNIGLHIGRRPILAFGNSDGDLAMLRYTLGGNGARLALLLHHDDADREVAYDREFKVSPLAEALDNASTYGIHIVSMKRDWNRVFGHA